jgi:hypothetical protein
MTADTIDPTILDRLTIAAANLRDVAALTDSDTQKLAAQIDELDAIVVALTPPPAEDPTPGRPDWLAAGCCGGIVTAAAHGPQIETWPGSPDQFWCTGWDPDAQPEPATEGAAS